VVLKGVLGGIASGL